MKFGFVDEHRAVWPVRMMCAVLGLSASGYYAWRARPQSRRSAANEALLGDIRLIHAESSGDLWLAARARCAAGPRTPGRAIPHRAPDAPRRHPRAGGAAPPGQDHRQPSWLSDRSKQARPQLPGGGSKPVWLADLTYIPTVEGWLYLAAILDMHTRKIVGWSMRETLHTEIALDALNMAVERQRPALGLIHHSDRGIQYAAEAYRQALAASGSRRR